METGRNVEALGVGVEWLRHEALDNPAGEIIHYWGEAPTDLHWQMARTRGFRVVLSCLHGRDVRRPRWLWRWKGAVYLPLLRQVLRGLYGRLGYGAYSAADAVCVVTPYEATYVQAVFGVERERIHVVENGCDTFMTTTSPGTIERGDYIVVLGYVSPVKQSVEIARRAKEARVPLLFLGNAQTPGDEYYDRFRAEVDGRWVRHEADLGPEALASRIRAAAGGLLVSHYESSPLAVLDYLAAGLPVLCADLPNLRDYYGETVAYTCSPRSRGFVGTLQQFHAQACQRPRATIGRAIRTWGDVGRQMEAIYRRVLERLSERV
jgi:glycosyltransferase involved in cell wall biosynthesis